MSQQEARSAVQRRIPDDGPQGEIGAAGVAFVAGQVEAIGLTIDVRHPQALSSGIGPGKASAKKVRAASSPSSLRGCGAR